MFTKEELEWLGRALIYRLRIDPGERSKQYSNAFHDGIVAMSYEYQKEILNLQEQKQEKNKVTLDVKQVEK